MNVVVLRISYQNPDPFLRSLREQEKVRTYENRLDLQALTETPGARRYLELAGAHTGALGGG